MTVRLTLPIAIAIVLTFICPEKSNAQIAITAGGNYSNIRSGIPLENKKPIVGYYLGGSIQYQPFKKFPRLSIINEVDYSQKGYQQDFVKNYTFRFNYLSFPVLMDYSLSKAFAIQAGVEFSSLVSTNVKQGLKTYNHFDWGPMLGVNWYNGERISCYSRLTYGLLPMLDYYEIDELGNFKDEIHDLRNICFSIGIKLNLYNEKIPLYK